MTVFASRTDLELTGHYMTFPGKNLDEKFTILILAIGLFHFFICAKYEQVRQNLQFQFSSAWGLTTTVHTENFLSEILGSRCFDCVSNDF